ncbi:hypothetical protein CUJ90_06160 [Paraburkholderia terricola]|nr:hypothetical protein CUJ90_06160 [Paraburkholderia terricola]
MAERSDTLNNVSFARRKAGIFLPELMPDTRGRLFVSTVLHGERYLQPAAKKNGAPFAGRAVFL